MLSFTLIILKDPTLLNSIADYTAQKITWPVQNGKTKEYNSNWFASKIHTDKKISETIKVISEQQCLWEDLEYTLTNKVDTSHALIVKQGNIVDNDLFPDFILNTIGYDDVVNYSLIGHILDKKERYYNLHNQMFLINVHHWKKIGSPIFARQKNIELQNVNRSADNFHDDYTPKSISKAEGKSRYTNNTAQGSQVISAFLEHNYKIRPFQKHERDMKICCYEDYKEQVTTIFKYFKGPHNILTPNIVYINSTQLRPKKFQNENDLVISVASPLTFLPRIREKYKSINKIIFYDISLPALVWTELFFKKIKEYDYEVKKLYEFYCDCDGEKFVLDSHRQPLYYDFSVKEYADIIEHLSKCKIEYRFGDISRPSVFSNKNLGDAKNVGANFTNVWEYQRNILRRDDLDWFEDEYVPMIKKQYNFEYLL